MYGLRYLIALLCAMPMLAVSNVSLAQDYPKLTGRVVDQANLLPPTQETALVTKLAALEESTQRQLVVATVSDLQGRDIADYAVGLFRAWGIGRKDQDDGVLFLIAPNDRRMRIEVGYGLEPVLTDALSGRIIRNTVTPKFKAGDMAGGIHAGTDAIIEQITLPPAQARANAVAAESKSSGSGASTFFLIFWLLVLFLVILPIVRGRRGGRRYGGKRSPWGAPVIIWGGGSDWGSGHSSWGGGGGFGGLSGGGGFSGGGGASGGW